jgi:V/A-type H+-transporting ATPase subunit E
MDQVRWNLAKEVQELLLDRAAAYVKEPDRYEPALARLLASAVAEFPTDVELFAELNAEDRKRLAPRWAEFVEDAVPDRVVALGPEPVRCTGGVIVRTPDNRIRVDNTVEGRMQRLEIRIYQTIVERLFPGQADVQSLTIG